jgi:hypothetical protein
LNARPVRRRSKTPTKVEEFLNTFASLKELALLVTNFAIKLASK